MTPDRPSDVLIDDCWQASARHADGKPHYDEERFPSGMKNLTDKIHSMGLKAGIYSSAGDHTCALQFGSLGFEEIDAQAYADWGFDYLKYDNCYSQGQHGTADLSFRRYKKMSDALLATQRDVLYSLCNWGQDKVETWASSIANSYRTTGDIDDTFDEVKPQCPETAWTNAPEGYGCSVANIVNKASPIMQKAVRGACHPLLPGPSAFEPDEICCSNARLLARSGHARGRPRRHDHGRADRPHESLGYVLPPLASLPSEADAFVQRSPDEVPAHHGPQPQRDGRPDARPPRQQGAHRDA